MKNLIQLYVYIVYSKFYLFDLLFQTKSFTLTKKIKEWKIKSKKSGVKIKSNNDEKYMFIIKNKNKNDPLGMKVFVWQIVFLYDFKE